ncbi:substrate-binding domain-containing protein [Devosia sp. 2618]|uniref:substrate-binding domain-containing protein n=1 Tax=Devosia sp. 2618 TaxID=3156454 RepID=UPI003391CF38
MKSGKLTFRFVTIAADEELFRVVSRGLADAAAAMNVDASLVGTPGFDLAEFKALVRQALADHVDGLALNIFDAHALSDVMAEAAAQNVPVVAFNIDAAKGASGNLAYVMQDFITAGEALGRRAAATLADGDKVIITMHDEGVGALEQRGAGIARGLSDRNANIRYVVTGREPHKGADLLQSVLKDFPARVIIGTGQPDSEAAGLVAQAQPQGQIYAAGFDLSPGIVDLISDGHLDCTIDQQPYLQGYYPVVQLALYLRFGLMPPSLDAGAAIVDRHNVGSVLKLSKDFIR